MSQDPKNNVTATEFHRKSNVADVIRRSRNKNIEYTTELVNNMGCKLYEQTEPQNLNQTLNEFRKNRK